MSEGYSSGPVWRAFGLTRSAYFVAPRRSLQSMPVEWQERFCALMDEAVEMLGNEAFPEYSVRRAGRDGKFERDPMREYRHTGPLPKIR